MDAILRFVADLAEVEGDSRHERCPESIPELPQTGELLPFRPLAGLDFDTDDGSVVTLQDEVDLLVIAGAPVTGRDR